MITRFRVEAEHNTQQDVIDELTFKAMEIIGAINQHDGKWECTADATLKTPTGYSGRMVFKFHLDEEELDAAES